MGMELGLSLGSTGLVTRQAAAVPSGPPAIVWEDLTGNVTAPGNGVLAWSGSAEPSGARANATYDPFDFDIRFLVTSPSRSDSVLIVLSATALTEYDPFDESPRVAIVGTSLGRLFYGVQENNLSLLGDVDLGNYPKYYRLTNSGFDVVVETSTDQLSWTTLVTLTSRLGPVTDLHVGCINSGPTNNDTIQAWAGVGA